MNAGANDQLIAYLGQFVTENKKNKIDAVLQYRTRFLTVVLEDIYQPHNASAVIRSCECQGIQDIHVIENQNTYAPNPGVTMGSNKWIDLYYYKKTKEDGEGAASQNTQNCITELKQRGYRIVAMTPHQSSCGMETLPLDCKTALLFGSEENGLSQVAIDQADEYLCIPMFGFTESYNISVSAALALFTLMQRIRKEKIEYELSESEKQELTLKWYRRILKKHKLLEDRFKKQKSQ